MVFVTDEREISPDSLRRDKLLEQRRGKLNILPGDATSHHLPDRPAIVVQILICCDVEMEFGPVHGITVMQAKPERGTKASMSARRCCDHAHLEDVLPKSKRREKRSWLGERPS